MSVRKIGSRTTDLLQCSIGEKVIWGSHGKVEVLDKAWGRILVFSESGNPCGYWSWSNTGGNGVGGGSHEEAIHRFRKNHVSFAKRFWEDQVGSASIIVKGKHYVDGGAILQSNKSTLGFSGAKFRIKNLTTGEIIETNNLWHQGTVPEEMNARDTHEFF